MNLKTLRPIMEQQANAIDTAMASFGLIGAVTGGTLTGNEKEPTHANYTWALGAELSEAGKVAGPKRIGNANPIDLDRTLINALGVGVTWRPDPAGLVVTAPLTGDGRNVQRWATMIDTNDRRRTIPVYENGIPDPRTGELIPWMDERYMFCGQVSYHLHVGKDPAIFCDSGTEPPARCGLACRPHPSPCAFIDLAFDWEKADRKKGAANFGDPGVRAAYESLEAWEALRAARRRERSCDGTGLVV